MVMKQGKQDINREQGERVLLEAAKLAFSNIRDLFRPDGTLIPFKDLHPDVAAAVVSMETSEVVLRSVEGQETVIKRTVKIELADKVKNLELLGRHLGVFPNQIAVIETVEVEPEHGAEAPGGVPNGRQ
jgi:phage terminase small subunit